MNAATPAQTPTPTNKAAMQLSLSWRTLTILLLIVIAAMAYIWKPWAKPTAARTITVQGEATVTAVPDEYNFQPIFENANLKAVTATGNEAVAQLKQLGVKDTDIKTSVTAATTIASMKPDPANETLIYPPRSTAATSTYSVTATVRTKALAQKVSDYLATTPATGQVTPQPSFSKATTTKLNLDARAKASNDAKSKATASAKQLDARVGKVIKMSDNGYGSIYALDAAEDNKSSEPTRAIASPTLQPGTNEVNYSFTVEFELK